MFNVLKTKNVQLLSVKKIANPINEDIVQKMKSTIDDLDLKDIALDENDKKIKRIINSYPDMRISIDENPNELKLLSNKSGHPEIEIKLNGKARRFILDTGAQMSVISTKLLEDVNKDYISEETIELKSASDQKSNTMLGMIDELTFDGVEVSNLPVILVDEKKLTFKLLGFKLVEIQGIIGWDILKKLNLTFDYSDSKMLINQEEVPKEYPQNSIDSDFPTVLLQDKNNEVLIFGIDTGARKSWISPELVDKLNLNVLSSKEEFFFGANGKTKGIVKVIESLHLKCNDTSLDFQNIRTGYTGFSKKTGFDGVIGNDVLGKVEFKMLNKDKYISFNLK